MIWSVQLLARYFCLILTPTYAKDILNYNISFIANTQNNEEETGDKVIIIDNFSSWYNKNILSSN